MSSTHVHDNVNLTAKTEELKHREDGKKQSSWNQILPITCTCRDERINDCLTKLL